MAKKGVVKKVVAKEECCMHEHHSCTVFLMKIASMAFVLFLITVWPWLNRILLSVDWYVYLAIMVVLMIIHITRYCKKK
jgi:hypothetical protein